jgi:hypothetical protein
MLWLSVPGILLSSQVSRSATGTQDAAASSSSSSAGPRIYSRIVFTTDSIDEGISTSSDSYAVQPELGYKGNTWKVGIFGSNCQYPSNSESLDLRPLAGADVKLAASTTLHAQAQYDIFSKSSVRNGYSFVADFEIVGHHAILREDSNFFGTGTSDFWLAYAKSWKAFWDFDYEFEAGYMMVTATNYQNYLAATTGLAYKLKDLRIDFLFAYNGGASQFNESSTPFLVKLSAAF